jgi:DNA-binding PadR family transcriptional regulator
MDERELLVLGLLKSQRQHGYQINEFIEKNLGRVSDMKKATAYAILKRLNKAGYVEVSHEQEGNRPPRQVYTITPLGEKKFDGLLRFSLANHDQVTPAGDIGLMFLDHLPKEEVTACLRERLHKLEELLSWFEASPAHGHGIGVDLSNRHRIALLRCDRDWLSQAIKDIEEDHGNPSRPI